MEELERKRELKWITQVRKLPVIALRVAAARESEMAVRCDNKMQEEEEERIPTKKLRAAAAAFPREGVDQGDRRTERRNENLVCVCVRCRRWRFRLIEGEGGILLNDMTLS